VGAARAEAAIASVPIRTVAEASPKHLLVLLPEPPSTARLSHFRLAGSTIAGS